MLEVDDVVLDQGLSNVDVGDVQIKPPGHGGGLSMFALGFL